VAQFDIEITDTSVKVKNKPRSLSQKLMTALPALLLGIFMLVKALPLFSSILAAAKVNIWSWFAFLVLIVFGARLIFFSMRALFPVGESLVCDADTLTIGRIPDYVFTGRWTYQNFSTKDIHQLKFTVVRTGRYGGTMGLEFMVNGKKKKTLFGLEAPEANSILQGLSKLGIDTVHDPAMPMIVEMALERRERKFLPF
jgi:hypothetical protein